MKRILVTGGSGFIGTNLIDGLINEEYEILNLDVNPPCKITHEKYYQNINILNFEGLKAKVDEFKPDLVVHLAAVTDLDGTDMDYYATNTVGTQNVINAASSSNSIKRVIFTSSMYVCQPGFIPTDYETYKPHTVYGQSKVEGELLVKNIPNPTFEWVIVRPTSIWGPWFKVPYIDFFNIVYQGKYFDFGRNCTKTYGFVENTVYQIKKLMTLNNVNQQTFYLGDKPATQINEWANEISVEMGKNKIKKIPFPVIKVTSWVGDILKVFKIKFPITSFRLQNMTTDNILPLDNLYAVAGQPPCTRIEGVAKTVKWLEQERGYKIGK